LINRNRSDFMNRMIVAFMFGLACAPGVVLAQDSDAPAATDTTPAPSADCATLDCNSTRQQQDNLNNNSGTPGAQDSLGDDRGTSGGSGTLTPTPNDSLGGDDNRGGLGGGGSDGLRGSGSLNGGSSSGGLSD
jgi:hypothetical protein